MDLSPSDLPVSHDPATRLPIRARIRKFLMEDVGEDMLLEAELLMLAFSTGIQDGTTFPDYRCFASNQTGNTVLLALGAVGVERNAFSMANISVSLSMFILGSWFMGQIGHLLGNHARWWLVVSSTVQTTMVFVAAALQYRYGIPSPSITNEVALGVIAMLAFAAGAQVALSRGLNMSEISTAMATAAYVDTLVDQHLFEWSNRSRNRRILFLLSLLLGSFTGAAIYLKLGSALALFVSAVVKLGVTIAFCFNKAFKEIDQVVVVVRHNQETKC